MDQSGAPLSSMSPVSPVSLTVKPARLLVFDLEAYTKATNRQIFELILYLSRRNEKGCRFRSNRPETLSSKDTRQLKFLYHPSPLCAMTRFFGPLDSVYGTSSITIYQNI